MSAITFVQVSELLKSGGWVLLSSRITGKRVDIDAAVTGVEKIGGKVVFNTEKSPVEGPEAEEVKFTTNHPRQPTNIYVYGTFPAKETRKASAGGGKHEVLRPGKVMLLEHPATVRANKVKERTEAKQQRRAQRAKQGASKETKELHREMAKKEHIIKIKTEKGDAYCIVVTWESTERPDLVEINRASRDLFDGANPPLFFHASFRSRFGYVISTLTLSPDQTTQVYQEYVKRNYPSIPA